MSRSGGWELSEIPLGGGSTAGVVRVGDTVRRPLPADHELVRRTLQHLESVGFAHGPRFRGIDEQGRQILGYIDGEVPAELGHFGERQLAEAARILARFHRATRSLATELGAKVLCHGDASPCNFVFRDGLPEALIDFDKLHPGPRHRDVGYAAWTWLNIGWDEDAEHVARRLAIFMDAYADMPRTGAVAAIIEAQKWLQGTCDLDRATGPCSRATSDWAYRSRRWVETHRATLQATLGE